MGRSWLQAPPRMLPHSAWWCNLCSSVMGGATGKRATQLDPDPSSLVPIPMLPPHSLSLVSHSSGLAGLSGSPYVESTPHTLRSGDQVGHLVLGSLLPFTILDLDFLAIEGASLAPRNPVVLLARTKTRAQHVAAVLGGSKKPSSIKCVVDSILF
jgi:hypothetical protein